MGKYIRKRLFGLVFVLIGITFLTFLITNISPIDPAEAFVRRNAKAATEEQVEKMREEMGLNKPIPVQYLHWLKNVVRLDFGESLVSRKPVLEEMKRAFPATLVLVGTASLIILVASIPLGVLAAVYRNSFFDHLIRVLTLFGISTPNFWLGFVLMYYFAVKLKLVPVVGFGEFKNVILPAVTLAVPVISTIIRFLRANMLEVMNKEFVVYAEARGIKKEVIIWKHIFKNAVPPMVTLFGQTIGNLVAGTAIIESVFSWPGIGLYAVTAIMNRDYMAINAYVLLVALIFVLCNLLADIINLFINPALIKEGGEV
ncbi:nickel ABC transporter permease [Desulforamulus ruminis]|uniref:nickel ABC transporter permease n=1 Tax=Desulforamulus ruminis TaxID=1564 RepID=UPI002FD8FB9E